MPPAKETGDRLRTQQKFVSLPFENGGFEQPLIGTVERLSLVHSQTETQAKGAPSQTGCFRDSAMHGHKALGGLLINVA
jgi:hypothetical protein